MIDKNAAEAIAELNKPIDYEKIDESVESLIDLEELDALMSESEEDFNVAFKGSDFEIPTYTDSAPDIATFDFIKDFGNHHVVPTSKTKAETITCDCGKNHEELYPIFIDTPNFEINSQDFIELYDKPNRPKLSN